jgi:hypothetical protein
VGVFKVELNGEVGGAADEKLKHKYVKYKFLKVIGNLHRLFYDLIFY